MIEDQFPFEDDYDWNKKECIGSGGFAKVYKVKNIKTGEYVAVKQIDMSKFDQDFKKQALMNEINVMKELKSLNTVSMIDCKLGKNYTYIVLELCDRDLKKTLLQSKCLEETEAIKIIIDIVQGFKFLVQKGYIHRDLKPENILEKSKIHKLADYGFTRKVEIDVEKLKEVCGTPLYMAPQLLYCKEYTSKCDVWSLGLILYEMIFGYLPWPTRYIQTYKQGVVIHEVSFPYNCEIGKNTKNFIQNCLKLQETERMTWKQVFECPLITSKKAGPPVIHTKVSSQLQKILIRVQQSSSRKGINIKKLFSNYSKDSQMDKKQFNNFMIEIDPQITSYESQQIFIASDFSRDGFVNLNEFKQFFLEIDYRPYKDIASRRIQEIAKMAQARNLNIYQFFEIFDQDKSSEIDYSQFCEFIRYIAPKINNSQIKLMWQKFDKDNSNSINLQQFKYEITKGTKIYTQTHFKNYQRANRNVQCLKNYLISRSITPSVFITKGMNKKTITLNDFGTLVKSINYTISRDQIIQMFRLIDGDNSEEIDYLEIQKFLTK